MPREELISASTAAPAVARMAARELHTGDMPIDQKPDISDHTEYDGDVVLVDRGMIDMDYASALAFMEEPVTIRLEPSGDRNSVNVFPVWVNGKGAEVFENGRWREIGYLPVGQVITVRRKVIEVIARAKVDNIQTDVTDRESERPNNTIQRYTTAVHSFSVLQDANPRGVAWLTEIRRRNL